MSLASLCNTTATVERKTKTIDPVGGVSSGGWSAVASGLLCTIQPLSGQKQEQLGKRSIVASHVCYFPDSPTFSNGDRLLSGTTYYDITYKEDQGGRGRVFALYLNQIKG